jgi:hypothetical protein
VLHHLRAQVEPQRHERRGVDRPTLPRVGVGGTHSLEQPATLPVFALAQLLEPVVERRRALRVDRLDRGGACGEGVARDVVVRLDQRAQVVLRVPEGVLAEQRRPRLRRVEDGRDAAPGRRPGQVRLEHRVEICAGSGRVPV